MCAIVGVEGVDLAAVLTFKGMHGLQNRAREFSGMAATDGHHINRYAAPGLAKEVFSPERLAYFQRCRSAIGQLRYATSGDQEEGRDDTQPIIGNWRGMYFAVGHNGDLTNTPALSLRFPHRNTTMDTEYFVRLIEASNAGNIEAAIFEATQKIQGSFAFVILLQDGRLIAVQCREQNHPLSIGRIGTGYAIASETTGLTAMGAEYLRDVEPGTMVIIDHGQLKTLRFAEPRLKRCAFELGYLSMPSSQAFGHSVDNFREQVGIALEEYCPVLGGADIVVGVPDSAILYARGYASTGHCGIYHPSALLRHHEAGRNFLLGTHEERTDDIELKHLFNAEAIAGSRIVIIDDSMVRGTTLRWLTGVFRRLKAKEVHIRIACPPIRYRCRYGVNTRTFGELIANRMEQEELRLHLQADSLEFLPMAVFETLLPTKGEEDSTQTYCFACWNGQYWHPTAW